MYSEPIEDDIEWTCQGLDDDDPTPTDILPAPAIDQTFVTLNTPVAASARESETRKEMILPADAVDAQAEVIPGLASYQPPIDNELMRQSRVQQSIARAILPDSELNDIEYRVRYGHGRGENPVDQPPRPVTPARPFPPPIPDGFGSLEML